MRRQTTSPKECLHRRKGGFFLKLCLFLTFCVSFLYVNVVAAATTSPMNIQVTLRGKKYPMSVSKISEIHKIIEEKSGLQSDQQALLFKGKMLPRSFGDRILKKDTENKENIGSSEGDGNTGEEEGEPDLASFGVNEGDTLNIVPQKTQRNPASTNNQNTNAFAGFSNENPSNDLSSTGSSSSLSESNPFAAFGANQAEIFAKVREILGDDTLSAFNDLLPDDFPRNPDELTPEKLEELQQHLSNLPQDQQQKLLQAQQQMIIKLLRSPLIEEYLTDDNLEFIRQRLLTLPEVKENLPAMVMEILQDATKFKESIKQLIEVYRMMPEGGFPGMPGMGGGMGAGMGAPPDFSGSNPFGSETSQSSMDNSAGANTKDGVDDLPEDDRNSEL